MKQIRIVEVAQNSWEEENLLLVTTLEDEQITKVLQPLVDEERECADGSVFYDNETLADILKEKYPDDIVILFSEPDYLSI